MTEADHDEKVTQAYRALGGEAPPRALDEAILAASRGPRARWRVPLSIAAVLVLAVGVTLRMLPQRHDAESVALAPQVIQTPRPAVLPEAPRDKVEQGESRPAASPADARVARSEESRAALAAAGARARQAEAPPRVAQAPAARAPESARRADESALAALERANQAEARAAAVTGAVESARRADSAGASAVPQGAASESAPAAPPVASEAPRESTAAAAGDTQVQPPALAKLSEPALTPEKWLERIAELRKQGREREAQESLAEFRKRYPDYKIPEALTR
jgi:hypothetical protein